MKKIYFLFSIIFVILFLGVFQSTTYAVDLDQIENMTVTIDPRMNDASLDIQYEITWKVLNSTIEGPLTWVQIGTPNSSFDHATAISDNIKKIQKYNSGNYVRIDFKKSYQAGESVTFRYTIHQPNMCRVSGSKCKFEFTPAWFTDIKVDNLTIRWNAESVTKSDNKSKEDNYLVWNKKNMKKGEKLTAKIEYNKSSFSAIKTRVETSKKGNGVLIGFIIFLIVVIVICSFLGGGGGYYGHSGFYRGGYGPRFYGGCVRSCACASSCACAHSSCASSCACACAGSGRAGCSRKDFYGTNVTTKKLQKAMKNRKKIK